MAFCTKCGNRNEDESRFCSYCGAPMYQAQQTEPGYGSTLDQERYGGRQPYEERAPYERRPGRERRLEPGDKLKWHHFLVYFGLWASAVVNVVTGLSYFSGSIYEGEGANAELVYFVFGNELKALDMTVAICSFALAVFAVITCLRLMRFRVAAPVMLYILSIANTVVLIAYIVLVQVITDVPLESGVLSGNVAGGLIGLVINYTYYKKRMYLFVN